MTTARTGGQILADQLRLHGVDHAFLVPGESYLPLLDALHDTPNIALTVCRQEGGAAYMAEAYGKLTGKPGICMVTRGPGASNALVGLHTAYQDSTPLVLLVGQVARHMTEREAFQEMDMRRLFGQVSKWAAQIDDAARIPEMLSHAFHCATAGRPGPVVLALPEDMLADTAEVADAPPYRAVRPHPAPADMARVRELLASAERPFVIVGGGGWSAQASADLEAFATANGLPVGTSFRCQDYINNDLPVYVGDVGIGINPALAERIGKADLILCIGARLGEQTTSGYTLLTPPVPKQRLIHVHADAEELGRVYAPALGINAGSEGFLAAARTMTPVDGTRWSDWLCNARVDYDVYQDPRQATPSRMNMADVVLGLRETLPPDAILTNGAGNYAAWVHRFHRYRAYRTQLAPTNGSMGYGLPAAVAAARVHPDRAVIAFAGDGCFLMNGQELATAVQYRLPLVVIVVNNGMYGTIRMHQERAYPGRVSGTELTNPDFAALARAYGAFGAVVERTEDFGPTFRELAEQARLHRLPALIEIRTDPEVVSPRATISELRGT